MELFLAPSLPVPGVTVASERHEGCSREERCADTLGSRTGHSGLWSPAASAGASGRQNPVDEMGGQGKKNGYFDIGLQG